MAAWLSRPELVEFCPDELRDFVLALAAAELAAIPEGEMCRRRELCEALLKDNRASGDRDRLKAAAMAVLKEWKAQTGQIADLERLGFTVTQGKKHYKLKRGNSGYFVTLPSTPSDCRGGANAAADLDRKFF